MKIVKFLFWVFGFGVATLEAQIPSAPLLHLNRVVRTYDQFVEQKLSELGAPGAAIAIVHGDSIVYMKCFGVREIGRVEPITPHTVFRVASLSKGFAAVLTGLLVQDGILQWDDKIIKYLPDFALKSEAHAKNLTIRHILSHTSGLPSHAYDNLVEANLPFENIVAQLQSVPCVWPVGQNYNYQNVIFSLIGKIIQATAGADYETLMKARLFTPLKMTNASLTREALLANPNHASPHIRRRGEWRRTEVTPGYYAVAPAAGINASISDMVQWLRALLGGRPEIVSPKVIEEVSKPVIKTRRELRRYHLNGRVHHAYYGLGWRIFDYAGTKLVFHSGGVRGYVSQIAFLPEHDLGIVVLLNSNIENIFVSAFLDMYFSADQYIFRNTAQF
ncbi:MAG: beta-lactamase family protein [candidate division KSB1 bacterium]|nr:beta-lactamase family protein [candidate division KSB1 bacterium]MDZ7365026.1 beta-lactamase family protein [candidate division KSB1 bacterium]MDZ7403421.1 beta-lactamase family protein [candidate division KSB1 bacterium]